MRNSSSSRVTRHKKSRLQTKYRFINSSRPRLTPSQIKIAIKDLPKIKRILTTIIEQKMRKGSSLRPNWHYVGNPNLSMSKTSEQNDGISYIMSYLCLFRQQEVS